MVLQQQVDAVRLVHLLHVAAFHDIVAQQHGQFLPQHPWMTGQLAAVDVGKRLAELGEGGRDPSEVRRLDGFGHLVIGGVQIADIAAGNRPAVSPCGLHAPRACLLRAHRPP